VGNSQKQSSPDSRFPGSTSEPVVSRTRSRSVEHINNDRESNNTSRQGIKVGEEI
jgi:hypothetical protein